MVEEKELYKELGVLTKEKNKWKENIPYVSSLLDHQSVKIQAKALWLLAEMGLEYTVLVKDAIPDIVSFCDSQNPLLRERAINALGRIGRGDYTLIESYWSDMFRFATDEEPRVRLSFIWASENIATNNPDAQITELRTPVFMRVPRLKNESNLKMTTKKSDIVRNNQK